MKVGVEPTTSGAAVEDVDKSTAQHAPPTIAQHLVITCITFTIAGVYLVLLSDLVGFGAPVFLFFQGKKKLAVVLGLTSCLLALFLFAFDVQHWEGSHRVLAKLCVGFNVVIFIVTGLLFTESFSVVPYAVYLISTPVLYFALRSKVYRNQSLVDFLNVMIAALCSMSCTVLIGYITWMVVANKYWDEEYKEELYLEVNCTLQYEVESTGNGTTAEGSVLTGCTRAFMLWIGPLLLVCWGFLFSFVLYFLVRAYDATNNSTAGKIDPVIQVFMSCLVLGMLGIWGAAGIAGSEMGLSNVVLAMSFLAMVMTGVVVFSVFGYGHLKEQVEKQPLGYLLLVSLSSDWAKSLLVILLGPFFVFYTVLSVVNQFTRKYFNFTKTLSEEERRLFINKQAHDVIQIVKKWDWTSILIKVIYWCIFFFLIMVGVSRVVTIFMSWLNEALSDWPLWATTLMFYAVGLGMFLIPVVPGVPVYIAGGVIITSTAQDSFGFWPGVFYSVGICFTIKLLAVACQQKIIGEYFGSSSVKVRQIAMVNSLQMRAVKAILEQPGFSVSKVLVLIGGPDWPTSVITGILRMSLVQMLLGTLPVFFLITPCCVAGALLLQEGKFWSSVASISLAISFVVQSFAMLAAIHYIEKAARKVKDEPFEPDVEVLELDKVVAEKSERRKAYMRWPGLSMPTRMVLCGAALSITASCYVFQLFSSSCFKSFSTTDSIAVKLDGNPLNVVQPLGWLALGLFALGCIGLTILSFVARGASKHDLRKVEDIVEQCEEADQAS